MRILFLASEVSSGSGGIKVFNRHLIAALQAEGHEVSVVSINDRKVPPDIGFAVYPCAHYGYFRKPAFVVQGIVQVFAFRPRLILCGHTNFLPVAALLHTICNLPFITVIHGIELGSISRLKIKWLKNSKSILAVSRFSKNWALRKLPGYPEDKVAIVGNTFDAQKFSPAPKPKALMQKFFLEKDDKIILTVGRLAKSERYKGHDLVVLSMKYILKEFPRIRYIIVGCGDDMPRVKRLAEEQGLKDKVILTGFIADGELAEYYNLCDVFVMPSRFEGFGIVFLEALSCGKPVVAGNIDGSRDALLDGKLGVLVDPSNPSEIAAAIVKILRHDTDARFFDGDFLRRSVIEHFGVESFRKKIHEALAG